MGYGYIQFNRFCYSWYQHPKILIFLKTTLRPILKAKPFFSQSLLCWLAIWTDFSLRIIEPLKGTYKTLVTFCSAMKFLLMKLVSFTWQVFSGPKIKKLIFGVFTIPYEVKIFRTPKMLATFKCTNLSAIISHKPIHFWTLHIEAMNFCVTPCSENTFWKIYYCKVWKSMECHKITFESLVMTNTCNIRNAPKNLSSGPLCPFGLQ